MHQADCGHHPLRPGGDDATVATVQFRLFRPLPADRLDRRRGAVPRYDQADATDDGAYHGALAVLIDVSDPNQKSIRIIESYTASTRTVTLSKDPDFVVTTSDTITILATSDAGGVWDMLLTGQKHNITNSSGKRLRQVEEAFVQAQGTIALVTDSHTVTLDSGAIATGDYYPHSRLTIV